MTTPPIVQDPNDSNILEEKIKQLTSQLEDINHATDEKMSADIERLSQEVDEEIAASTSADADITAAMEKGIEEIAATL